MDKQVDFAVHEGMLARMERSQRRMFILCILLIIALVGSWIGFFVYESQFEDVVITAEQSADTGNNYAVGGDMYGNEAESND